jgi:hypothetical protein
MLSFTGNGLTCLVDEEQGMYEVVLATATCHDLAFLDLSQTLSFTQFAPPIAAQTHPQVIRTPGFQIKQPMIEDIRNNTVAWSSSTSYQTTYHRQGYS